MTAAYPSTRRHSSASPMAIDGSSAICSLRRDASSRMSSGTTIGSAERAMSSHSAVTIRSFSTAERSPIPDIGPNISVAILTPHCKPVQMIRASLALVNTRHSNLPDVDAVFRTHSIARMLCTDTQMNWLIVRFLCGFLAVSHLTAPVADPVLEPDATFKSLTRPLQTDGPTIPPATSLTRPAYRRRRFGLMTFPARRGIVDQKRGHRGDHPNSEADQTEAMRPVHNRHDSVSISRRRYFTHSSPTPTRYQISASRICSLPERAVIGSLEGSRLQLPSTSRYCSSR